MPTLCARICWALYVSNLILATVHNTGSVIPILQMRKTDAQGATQ